MDKKMNSSQTYNSKSHPYGCWMWSDSGIFYFNNLQGETNSSTTKICEITNSTTSEPICPTSQSTSAPRTPTPTFDPTSDPTSAPRTAPPTFDPTSAPRTPS